MHDDERQNEKNVIKRLLYISDDNENSLPEKKAGKIIIKFFNQLEIRSK